MQRLLGQKPTSLVSGWCWYDLLVVLDDATIRPKRAGRERHLCM